MESIMKTISVYTKKPWQFERRQIELPDSPPAGEVMIKVEACGVCGSDLAIVGLLAEDWSPFGHEIAGVVVQVGDRIDHVKGGDKVVLESSGFCGKCELCRNGRVDLCNKAPSIDGIPAMGYSQYMCAPGNCMVPYEGLAAEVACLSEPAGVALDMVKTAEIELGDNVCVIGPGPIGLMVVGLVRHRGAGRVVCIGQPDDTARLDMAEQLGAEMIVHDGSFEELADLQSQFDRVMLTAPPKCIPSALQLLEYGGVLTYIGIAWEDGTISFDADNFHFRKLQLRASFASPGIYLPKVLKLLKAGVIPGERLITHRFSLDKIEEALTTYRDNKNDTIKIVIQP
jgi:L-iditol 2-dehydrogenase